jgi:ribosomal protein L4
LVLTAGGENSYNVYLSGRNIPDVQVMRYADATAYEILWSEAVVVELSAFEEGGAAAKETEEEATDA